MLQLNFFKKKPFDAKDSCIHFLSKDKKRESFIYYRKPTGDEVLNFVHTTLASEQSNIRNLNTDITMEALQRLQREKKHIPYAKKIVTKIEGYGENTFDFVEKYYPHHLEVVAIEGFRVDDNFKKKD